jgi:hypothetical protein
VADTIVNDKFSTDWQARGGNRVRVEKIYQVILPRDDEARKKSYRYVWQSEPSLNETLLISTASEKSASTGLRMLPTYHASQCICNLGVKSSSLCDILSCGICQIVKSSFNVFAFGIPHNSGRYAKLDILPADKV